MLGTGRLNKTFSTKILMSKKFVTNMKHAFTNVPFRHIQLVLFKSGLDLKGSSKSDEHIPHEYFLMDLK